MRIFKVKQYLSNEKLLEKMKAQENIGNFINWQIIYSVQVNPGKKAEDYALYLGASKSRVYKSIAAYNNKVPKWNVGKKRGGRREERAYLTLPQEKALMAGLAKKATNDNILSYSYIKKKVEKKVGKKVSDDYIWDLFKRHSWKKKAPPTTKPVGDEEKTGGI